MNGRLYDPLLRRFLNADENIQDPYNTQNYNKYGYVLNNPLMFNDPSGEIFGLTALVSAVVIGAIIGAASYVVSAIITGQSVSLLGLFKSTIFGAISGAVTFGIGSIFQPALQAAQTATGLVSTLKEIGISFVQAAAHGVAQGTLSLMQGGNATMGAISGAFGSLGASAFGLGMKSLGLSSFANSGAGMVVSGAVLGGVGSELTGGNFWQGAVIGGIVAGLNHVAHQISSSFESGIGGDDPKEDSPIMKILKANSPAGDFGVDSVDGSSASSFNFKRLGTANWQVADVSGISYTSVTSLYPNVDIFYLYATRAYYQLPIKYSNGYILPSNIASNIAAKATDFGLKETRNYYTIRNGNVVYAEMLNFFKTSVNAFLGTWGGRFSLSPPMGYKGTPTPYRRNLNPFQ